MTYPLVRFVASPDVSAAVRFDFNAAGTWADDDVWPDHDGFSLGVPELEGDPDGVGVEFGLRELSFNFVVRGSDQAAAKVLSALSREILRATNWLMFQKSPDVSPVWFKTYRSQPGDLDLDNAPNDLPGQWFGVGVTLAADPYAYGARVDLDPVTIYNDPAAPLNPMSYVLPEIKGDAPAPLAFTVYPANAARQRYMVSAISTLDTFAGPYTWAASFMSAVSGADVGAVVSNPAYVGGDYTPITFATNADYTKRMTGALPSNPPAGTYKILARLGRSDTSSQFTVGLVVNTSYEGPRETIGGTSDSATWATWVDLGNFDLPPGANSELPAGIDRNSLADIYVDLYASRVSGTGELRVDQILAVPMVEDSERASTLFVDARAGGIGADNFGMSLHLDGDLEVSAQRIYTGSLDQLSGLNMYPLAGGFPHVSPGANNVLHVLLHVDPLAAQGNTIAGIDDNTDKITETLELRDISYQPRYLYLAAD